MNQVAHSILDQDKRGVIKFAEGRDCRSLGEL